MNPQEFLDLAKAWGPLGAVAVVVAQAFLRRTPNVVDQEASAIDALRHDMMQEFKDMRSAMGDLRDRVSRIEGKIEK